MQANLKQMILKLHTLQPECPQVVHPLHNCQESLKGQGYISQLQRGQPLTGHKGIHQRIKGSWIVG